MLRSFVPPEFLAFVFVTLCLVGPAMCSSLFPNPAQHAAWPTNTDTTEVAQQRKGGAEYRVSGLGMDLFSRLVGGVAFETAYRWPGSSGKPDGHFSIGVQLVGWPSVGRWSELPFDIATVDKFRVNDRNGFDGTVRFGSVIVEPNEVFLIQKQTVPIRLLGLFYTNPLSNEIFEYSRYRISDMQARMFGVNIPVRWYLGEHLEHRPRWYFEGGFGLDVLLIRASYQVTTQGIMYDEGTNTIQFSTKTSDATEPLGGAVSRNLLFSHGSVGAGVAYGRFSLYAQARFLFTSKLQQGRTDHKRIRGNILAIPALAGADQNADLLSELARDGVVPYGSTALVKNNGAADPTEQEGDAIGISRFWDPNQWLVGLAFRLH